MNTAGDAKAAALIRAWLTDRLSTEQQSWLDTQLDKVLVANSDRDLHITLGMIPRKLGRADLNLSTDELAAANDARPCLLYTSPSPRDRG